MTKTVQLVVFCVTFLAVCVARGQAQTCVPNPYGGCLVEPPPAPCPDAANPYLSNLPCPDGSEPVKPLWRHIPDPEPGHVFSLVQEQGPAFPLTMIALKGPVPAFVWYSPDFGGLWLVVDGVYNPERICTSDQPPGLRLVALDMDDDGQDDLLMHDPRTGIVARFYTRNLAACQ